MEAARILTLKGYHVTIFEKESYLGGQLHLVHQPVAKEKMNWIVEYHSNEMKRLNVDVRLNTEASIDEIKALNPYAVFIATGAKPIMPEIDGIHLAQVCDYEDVLLERRNLRNKKMAVMGSGMVCYSVAQQLAKDGNEVTLIDVPTATGAKVSAPTRMMLFERMKGLNIEIIEEHKVTKILPESIIIEDNQTGTQQELAVDHLVVSMGTQSYNPLEESYRQHFDNVFVLGDAIDPGTITHAVKDGFEKAWVLEDIVVQKQTVEENVLVNV